MGGTLQPINLKKDYKNRDILDYNRWNADQKSIEDVINKLISSTADGDSGADNISMTAIPSISTDTSLQSFLETLVAMLISAQAAAKLGAVAPDTDISGTNIQAILNSIKAYIDTALETLNANMNLMNNSLADDINERVKSADLAKTDGTGGSSIVGSQNIIGVPGNTVYQQLLSLKQAIDQIVAGQIPDGYIGNEKLSDDIKIGSLAALATAVKTSVVNALNEIVGNIGDLSTLSTTDKTKIVNALNEILGNVGDKANLTTVNKTSLVGAVNEVKSTVDAHLSDNMPHKDFVVQKSGDTMSGALDVPNIIHKNSGSIQHMHDFFQHAGITRWAFATESNSNFSVYDYDANGATPRNCIQIVKSTGQLYNLGKRVLNQDDYDQLFQYANDGKTGIANAVTAKGVAASPTDTFATLATKIGQIQTGKRIAITSVTANLASGCYHVAINGLTFTPSHVVVYMPSSYNLYSTQDLYVEVFGCLEYGSYGNSNLFGISKHDDYTVEIMASIINASFVYGSATFDVSIDTSYNPSSKTFNCILIE